MSECLHLSVLRCTAGCFGSEEAITELLLAFKDLHLAHKDLERRVQAADALLRGVAL